jgi:SAM-dependent methyltransferase
VTGAALVVQGDALHLPLPDGSVDLAISSPPYFNLRSYGAGPGEIGNERTPAEFLEALWAATRELVRVLKPTGSIFINLGDKYAGAPSGPAGSTTGVSPGHNQARDLNGRRKVERAVPEKSLLGLPWAYALGCTGMLANLGGPDPGLNLILRAPIVLHKINGLPESVRDRVRTSDQEMLFHLVKQPRYYSALDELREPHTMRPQRRQNGHKERQKLGVLPAQTYSTSQREDLGVDGHPLGKLPGSVWSMASEPLRLPEWLGVNHYAAFSSELPRRLVNGFSPPGICLECGAGRVPVVEREKVSSRPGINVKRRGQPLMDNGGNQANEGRAGDYTATILGYACSCFPLGTRVAMDGWKPPPTRPGVVLDPFSGTGTVPMVSRALGRIGVGVDLSHSYCRAARWRVHHDAGKAISRTWVERQGSLL